MGNINSVIKRKKGYQDRIVEEYQDHSYLRGFNTNWSQVPNNRDFVFSKSRSVVIPVQNQEISRNAENYIQERILNFYRNYTELYEQ